MRWIDKSDTKDDRTLELTAQSIIEAVDGQFLDVAKKENFNTSDVIRETFVKNEYTCQKPAFIREGDILKLSTSDEGASIYYTLDGSDPTVNSSLYEESGIKLTENGTVKAIVATYNVCLILA